LNRQFLFRQADVGKTKAETAAKFVEKRVKGVKITPFVGKIQDKDEDYYMQFDIVICGLDSIEARRWINATLVGMVDMNDQRSLKPLVDGGTEGMRVWPIGYYILMLEYRFQRTSACHLPDDDLLYRMPARYARPASTSPTMHHCHDSSTTATLHRMGTSDCMVGRKERSVSYMVGRRRIADTHTDDTLDTDDPDHITWLYHKALTRTHEFNIPGVTYAMTQGVVKNIIPAIASTNAIVAASCCNEAFKIVTGTNPALGFPGMNNYMMYTGDDSVYTYTFEHQKKDDCPVCGNLAKPLQVDRRWTLEDFIETLRDLPEAYVLSIYSLPARSCLG